MLVPWWDASCCFWWGNGCLLLITRVVHFTFNPLCIKWIGFLYSVECKLSVLTPNAQVALPWPLPILYLNHRLWPCTCIWRDQLKHRHAKQMHRHPAWCTFLHDGRGLMFIEVFLSASPTLATSFFGGGGTCHSLVSLFLGILPLHPL